MAQANPQNPNLDEIFDLLTRGLGHEHVNDDNVQALIDRAERGNAPQVAQQLQQQKLAKFQEELRTKAKVE